MTAYLIISPYGSLNFNDDWRQRDQQSVDYTQKFIAGDAVTVQYAITRGNDQSWTSLDIRHYNIDTGESIPVASSQVEQTDVYTFYNATIDASAAGCFGVAFELTDGEGNVIVVKESVFQVLADYPTEDEDQLMLFRYTNAEQKDNTIFASDFSFRCEAAFFPQNEAYNVEDNNFRDQAFDLSKLSAEASTTRGLTVGGRLGVPTWVAEKLSRIFSCTEVYVGEAGEEVEYIMVDGGSVERTNMGEMYPKYVFSINLERTITSANSVRIGVITPIGESAFEIDLAWIEVDPAATIRVISVTAPDDNWTVGASDTSWLSVSKIQNIAFLSITQNTTDLDRSQAITFTWTDPDTGAVLTRVATVNQLTAGEEVEYIRISGRILDASSGLPMAALVGFFADGTRLGIRAADSQGQYSYLWSISEVQYNNTSALSVVVEAPGYVGQTIAKSPLPNFSGAVLNGLTFPDISLVKS